MTVALRRPSRWTLAVAVALLTAACGREPAPPPAPERASRTPTGWNLVLISIDTLRADRLGCYGYGRPTSPAIDALAARGARFEWAIAESPWTLPSHVTLFTGLHPATHAVKYRDRRLRQDIPTLGSSLADAGYRCYAHTGGGFVAGRYGLSRGFEVYEDQMDLDPDARTDFAGTLVRGRAWLEAVGDSAPTFLFLHTYDVHCPYDPPAPYRDDFATRPAEDRIDTSGLCQNAGLPPLELTDGQMLHLSDQYDASIRAVDDALARFVAYLEGRDAFRNTVLVLLSDHGEEFNDHGGLGHMHTLYMELLRIPLIVIAPGVAPRVIRGRVGLADVMPTLLDLLGLPPVDTQGISVRAMLEGAGGPSRPLHSELDRHHRSLRSVLDGPYHLILAPSHGADRWELFDLEADPAEQRDLGASRGEEAARLRELVLERTRTLPRFPATERPALTPDEEERLRALGYVQ